MAPCHFTVFYSGFPADLRPFGCPISLNFSNSTFPPLVQFLFLLLFFFKMQPRARVASFRPLPATN
ncbi:hypothetical protein D918_02054 [Trichuris suis]|nr:hypothetical protein D918_02054 [Trichuris suis]